MNENNVFREENRNASSVSATTWLLLFFILSAGAFLRLKGLTVQSLWLDELHTVIETDPQKNLKEIFEYLKTVDQHPPLYFVSIHYWFKAVGYNDYTAKLFSALAGIGSIVVMFFLGKELKGKNAGLITAALVSINYFNIYYSQEARSYIFSFLFAGLSYLFYVKALKVPSVKAGLLYALATSLLLYTHYYSLFVVAAQAVSGLFFILFTKKYKPYFTCFETAALVTLLLYAPWLSTLSKMVGLSSFWLDKPSGDFFISYYGRYFDDFIPVIVLCTLFFLVLLIAAYKSFKRNRQLLEVNTEITLFGIGVILISWIFISYSFPYIRSIVSTPMLTARYTIVTLPAFILAIAVGIDQMKSDKVKAIITVCICLLSTFQHFVRRDYYVTKHKQEWRDTTKFIAENNQANYPIISDRSWYLPYYFGQIGSTYHVMESSIASLQDPNTRGVWVVTGHNGAPLTPELENELMANYRLEKEFAELDTSAKLYIRTKSGL